VYSKAWPSIFANSRKPVDVSPVLEARIALLRSSGVEPEGNDLHLFMESYDDDLTSLDVRTAMQYLQMNEYNTLPDFRQAEKRGAAWLDDRTLDRPLAQELSGTILTTGGENLSMQIHQTIHRIQNSEIADAHRTWYDTPEPTSNECDMADVAQQTTQDSAPTNYHTMQSSLSAHESRSIRQYQAPLNADDLQRHLRERQFNHTRYLDADRRLVYIGDPDASYLSALIRTASAYQERSLRDIICKYIAQDTSLKVSISEGGTEYQLGFHIPYFAMRYRPLRDCKEPENQIPREWMNVDFLGTKRTTVRQDSICGIYRAQISVTICGTDNTRWTAYCFEDRYFDEDGEMGGDEQTDEHQSDQIARGAFGAEDIIRDPREYFMHVFLIRMRQVHRERMNLLRRIESGIKVHLWSRFLSSTAQDERPSALCDRPPSGWIDPTVQLLGRLLDDIADMKDVWTRFTSDTGDMAYFADTHSDPRMSTTFIQLHDVFSDMMDLENKLRRIVELCEQRRQTANLRLASDSKRNAELTVYFISPFAIVSAFFSIPVPIIGFDRNILSFSIAIVLYIIVLQTLLFFWGSGCLQLPWWNKVLKKLKALRSIDLGLKRKSEVRTTAFQGNATAGCVV
jgi:hypothetical protein